jgi:TnpA family transposase
MPVNLLSDAERLKFNSLPAEISKDDLISFFTLSAKDFAQIPQNAGLFNQLGFALHLLLLRFLGFHLADLESLPPSVVNYVAAQLSIEVRHLAKYPARQQTRSDHQRLIENYLGFRYLSDSDFKLISNWLTQRALEHDSPLLLMRLLCERLLSDNFVRPGFSVLERMVATARNDAENEIFRLLEEVVDEIPSDILNSFLAAEQPNYPTQIALLRQSEISNSPATILSALQKLKTLQELKVDQWDLSAINPNRRKQLAQIGFRSTAQALMRMNHQRRYTILIVFLSDLYSEILDEIVEIYDRLLIAISDRANRKLKESKIEIALETGEKMKLLQNIVGILIDPGISDGDLRKRIYEFVPESTLRTTYEECERIVEPLDKDFFELIGKRYSNIRQFVPTFLDSVPLQGNAQSAGIIKAVEILRELNESGQRALPDDAPVDFVPAVWWDYVVENNKINRKYYELCVLYELRLRLRSADIWVEGSRRYAKLVSYLIPEDKWIKARSSVCELLSLPENGESRLKLREAELRELYGQFDQFIGEVTRKQNNNSTKNAITFANVDPTAHLNKTTNVRLENGRLIVTKLPGEEITPSSEALKDLIGEMLPQVELTDLLIEVDNWTHFTTHFEHPIGAEPRSPEALRHFYASILAQSCNFGLSQMQRMSGLTYDSLKWYSKWYIRPETLKSAFSGLVNYHYDLPLAKLWGSGILSSSDGQRFPVSVKTKNAVSIPRYFGYSRGLTFYTFTSDQYSQYGTKVIPSTMRDATYVLDEILDNETELTILEHTTDTAGYTHLVFGLFDLLGLQFSPRLANIGGKTFYNIGKKSNYKNIKSLIKGKIDTDLILRHWDELLWVAGSLKKGYVTASLLINKLMSTLEKNSLTRALEEWGKISETIFMLKYLQDPAYQKKTIVQLNKGEAMHALRRNIFVANQGKIRKRIYEDQLNQASCLNLVVNAVVIWNTVYMQAALDKLKSEGHEIKDEDIKNLSPARSEHINMYGKYYFDLEEAMKRIGLRELKKVETDNYQYNFKHF